MNDSRRATLAKAKELLSEAFGLIESCRDDEQDAFDALPENLQDSERGGKMADAIANLTDALCSLEDIESSLDAALQ